MELVIKQKYPVLHQRILKNDMKKELKYKYDKTHDKDKIEIRKILIRLFSKDLEPIIYSFLYKPNYYDYDTVISGKDFFGSISYVIKPNYPLFAGYNENGGEKKIWTVEDPYYPTEEKWNELGVYFVI